MFCRRTRIALAGVVSLLLLAGLALALLGGAGDAFAQGTTDYDTNNNGLIDVTTLDQLNAIRYDLDGNGDATHADYVAAFPNRVTGMGCQSTCAGYELRADLDFDDNNSGSVGAGDTYPNWTPIGTTATSTEAFTSTFQGNDHTIANMTINSANFQRVGLFGSVDGTIEGVEMTGVAITASYTSSSAANFNVGGLVGHIDGTVRASSATGTITASALGADQVAIRTGGLVGHAVAGSSVAASYAAVNVTANSSSLSTLSDNVGGLVGFFAGTAMAPSSLAATYARGNVSADRSGANVGGLIGLTGNMTVTASYATGTVAGSAAATRGLIGDISPAATVTASYWDTVTSGIDDDADSPAAPPEGKATTELQSPTGYTGIYAGWNVDVDGETRGRRPLGLWHQHPIPGSEIRPPGHRRAGGSDGGGGRAADYLQSEHPV